MLARHLDPLALQARGFAGLRVVGDVHGDARGFEAAAAGAEAQKLFLLQLGDLTDGGPDSPAVLRRIFGLIDAGAGLFLLGNHEHKLRRGPAIFVHAAFHPAMLHTVPPPDAGARKAEPPVTRALYGQVAAGIQSDGYPERLLHWVETIPQGIITYCGHDTRSTDGRPLLLRGRAGGEALFMDTGAGKGGHLSWIDLPI
jgi:protein phosphatase